MKINLDKLLKIQIVVLIVVLIIVAVILCYTLYLILNQDRVDLASDIIQEDKIEVNKMSRIIDGVIVEAGKENLFPVGVMIDNHPDSRPNYGLSLARVVYETYVENGSTRFLTFFTPDIKASSTIEKIGPVRSTRPYFVLIADEYDALLAHAGGSVQALDDIETLGVNNLDEIAWWGPDYFWRVYSRPEPHNLFTSEYNLARAAADWELVEKTPVYTGWKFEPEIDSSDLKPVASIEVDFSVGDDYDVEYRYEADSNSYFRFQSGEAHIDALNNGQIKVKNVVKQYINQPRVIDEAGRIVMDLIGSGEAVVYRDGVEISGRWKKMNVDSRTVFYDKFGDEIEFQLGSIWVEIMVE